MARGRWLALHSRKTVRKRRASCPGNEKKKSGQKKLNYNVHAICEFLIEYCNFTVSSGGVWAVSGPSRCVKPGGGIFIFDGFFSDEKNS